MARRRRHRQEFKLAAIARMERALDVAALAAELGIDRGLLYKWSNAYRLGGAAALRLPGERAATAEAVAGADPPTAGDSGATPSVLAGALGPAMTGALERKVAQQALELDFFRAALRHFAGRCRENGGSGGTGSTP